MIRSQRSDSELEAFASNDENLGAESDDQSTNNSRPSVNRENPVSSQGSNPPLTRNRSFYTPYMEDKLCRRLKFHFMGPDEKIKAKRKCPWKLIVQILKILMVTAQLIQLGYTRASFVEYQEKTIICLENLFLMDWTNSYETMPYPPAIGKYALYRLDDVVDHINYAMQQLINFGHNRSDFVDFTEKTTLAMKHLYLKDWSNSYETLPYPPATGRYALYENKDFIEHINFAMKAYNNTENSAIGSLRLPKFRNGTHRPMKMCLKQYSNSYINSTSNTYRINSTITNPCYDIGMIDGEYNITKYTRFYKIDFENIFDRLLVITLKFTLKSFRLDMNERHFPPQLYTLNVEIQFDDSNKDGQMLVKLDAVLDEIEVKGHSSNEDAEKLQRIGLVVFDSFVIAISIISAVLCSRSVLRAQALRRETVNFFYQSRGKKLSLSDKFEFVNLWYVTIIINDILTIIGSGYKIQLETRALKSSSSNYDICGLMLGTGSLLAWLGVLRYIGYFQQFNILIITLKKAFPNMLRFLACCMMLYIGFVICGWVVLGPYHIKFRQMSTASECLFSLVNGDDMFVTFSATMTNNQLVWYYSRIYLYIFISLFIYAVLNLFIAVIMDTYETIKKYNEEGFPKSELFQFIDQCDDPVHSPVYRQEDNSCNPISYLCCFCKQFGDLNDITTAYSSYKILTIQMSLQA